MIAAIKNLIRSARIDLSDENKRRLEAALSEFVGAARRTGGRKRTSAPATSNRGGNGSGGKTLTATDPEQARRIREWARSGDFPGLGDRGRIPQLVVDAYNADQDAKQQAAKDAREAAKTATRRRKATAKV